MTEPGNQKTDGASPIVEDQPSPSERSDETHTPPGYIDNTVTGRYIGQWCATRILSLFRRAQFIQPWVLIVLGFTLYLGAVFVIPGAPWWGRVLAPCLLTAVVILDGLESRLCEHQRSWQPLRDFSKTMAHLIAACGLIAAMGWLTADITFERGWFDWAILGVILHLVCLLLGSMGPAFLPKDSDRANFRLIDQMDARPQNWSERVTFLASVALLRRADLLLTAGIFVLIGLPQVWILLFVTARSVIFLYLLGGISKQLYRAGR